MISAACDLCGADDYFVRFPNTEMVEGQLDVSAFRCTHDGYGSHPQIVQCNQCGYVYANPRWDETELLDAYGAVEDETYVHERVGREKTFNKHLDKIESLIGEGEGKSILDVGAYIGVFVEAANKRGWDAQGVEPSSWAARIAQSNGLPVIQGTLDSEELTGKQFDVITLWDVIEHVNSPASELEKAFSKLNPGGVVVAHTMDIDSLAAKVMGKRWPWLMDMHIHYFSRDTLSKMLENTGFDVIWVGSQGRYLSLGYIASRLGGLSKSLGAFFTTIIDSLGLADVTVPVNFGDLITAAARKPDK